MSSTGGGGGGGTGRAGFFTATGFFFDAVPAGFELPDGAGFAAAGFVAVGFVAEGFVAEGLAGSAVLPECGTQAANAAAAMRARTGVASMGRDSTRPGASQT